MTTSKKIQKRKTKRKPLKVSRNPKGQFVRFRHSFVSRAFLNQFGLNDEDLTAIQKFSDLNDRERVEAARKLIQESVVDAEIQPDARFGLAVAESESLLSGYATLDDRHRGEIQKLIKEIKAYLRDETRKRPFNALMIAAPGAGKSHFIRQLANAMGDERVQAVTFNMATMQSPDDMAQPIDELRNLKVNDRFPLLFLDEFDSDPSRYPALLPLLWDGELQISHRDLKLGKAVIVLAGSNPDLPKVMDEAAKMRLENDNTEGFVPASKLVDLLSRISGGVIAIPDLDLRSDNRDRRVDKVCVAVALMKNRFGKDLKEIPRSILTFIAQTRFRYGVRSIAHLIDVIESNAIKNDRLKAEALGLPITSEKALQESNLKLHLVDKDRGFGIVNRWNLLSKDKVVVRLNLPPYRFF